ncbi:MAG: aminotransferase [Ponticaulis sp.]|nr:aminotransferase [Ponticaulis sp.]
MKLTRRSYLSLSAASIAGLAACRSAASQTAPGVAGLPSSTGALPDLTSFPLGEGVTYLNCGSQFPVSVQARKAIDEYLDHKQDFGATDTYRLNDNGPIEKFAKLVNADPEELSYVQSTTTGEMMVVRSLGLPEQGARVVCDTLHFFGSLPLYADLGKKGCDIGWVKAVDGRIRLEDLDKAITPGTKLVSLSLVSTINGFEQDLKAVCDLAHSRGALVYADIIHAAGCVPVDLHASGVDFAACASYKWLMGEFGMGFLYARKGVWDQLERTNWGYYGMSSFSPHIYPYDAPGDTIVDYGFQDSANGWFAVGTHSHTLVAHLNASLDYLLEIDVENIQAYTLPMIERLKEGMAEAGLSVLTPPESKTPLVTGVYENAYAKWNDAFKAAGINTTVSRHRMRPSVSLFNTMDDVEHFLEVLTSV